ncbi:hypothetical protein Tco_0205168 [Tanacetum coccineum]
MDSEVKSMVTVPINKFLSSVPLLYFSIDLILDSLSSPVKESSSLQLSPQHSHNRCANQFRDLASLMTSGYIRHRASNSWLRSRSSGPVLYEMMSDPNGSDLAPQRTSDVFPTTRGRQIHHNKGQEMKQVRGNPTCQFITRRQLVADLNCVCSRSRWSIVGNRKNFKEAMADSAWDSKNAGLNHQTKRMKIDCNCKQVDLLLKGMLKKRDIDFEESFAQIAPLEASRMKEVYVAQRKRFVDPVIRKVYLLRKALYGLKQAQELDSDPYYQAYEPLKSTSRSISELICRMLEIEKHFGGTRSLVIIVSWMLRNKNCTANVFSRGRVSGVICASCAQVMWIEDTAFKLVASTTTNDHCIATLSQP